MWLLHKAVSTCQLELESSQVIFKYTSSACLVPTWYSISSSTHIHKLTIHEISIAAVVSSTTCSTWTKSTRNRKPEEERNYSNCELRLTPYTRNRRQSRKLK
jgi:hypothetical protein